MNNIEVKVLHESHNNPAGMMMFLARLTQRGHDIKNMDKLIEMYDSSMKPFKGAKDVAKLPHGTIKRFAPITVAVVGASRRFLAQIRTHSVGLEFVSASLQYSDYSEDAKFVVPYEVMAVDYELDTNEHTNSYLEKCQSDLAYYRKMVDFGFDNDTAGYTMNQALRNVLIIQGNHEAWMNLIRSRACNRNTNETQYVMMLIWKALLYTNDGFDMFTYAGPDCLYGKCREGKMTCMKPFDASKFNSRYSIPSQILEQKWPLLKEC